MYAFDWIILFFCNCYLKRFWVISLYCSRSHIVRGAGTDDDRLDELMVHWSPRPHLSRPHFLFSDWKPCHNIISECYWTLFIHWLYGTLKDDPSLNMLISTKLAGQSPKKKAAYHWIISLVNYRLWSQGLTDLRWRSGQRDHTKHWQRGI